jgi:hypothetical protein
MPDCSRSCRIHAVAVVPLLLWSIAAKQSAAQQTAAPPRLVLEEVTSLQVPDSLAISGAVLSQTGSIAIWTTVHRFAALVDGQTIIPMCNGQLGLPLSARFVSVDTVEIVDAIGPHLWRATRNDCRRLNVVLPDSLFAAASVEGEWLMASSSARWSVSVAFLGARNSLRELAAFIASAGDVWAVHLAGGRAAVAALLRPPYTWRAVVGGSVIDGEPGADMVDSLLPSPKDSARILSLPVRQLGRGFVQILSDLTSDRRLFIVYGPRGEMERAEIIRVPLGILDVNTATSRVLMIRRSDILELVTYAWYWRK